MVKIKSEYLGDLSCKVTHTPSGNSFKTDAPLDNRGKARFISPTDMLAGSIASCVSTIMGIKAKDNNIDINGLEILAYKEMKNDPYRMVKKLTLEITFPYQLNNKDFNLLSNVVKTCPVTRSLHPDIELEYHFKTKD